MSSKSPVLLGLSGGVDSAVAAFLLKEAGYPVTAAFMKTWINEEDIFADCPWEEDLSYARAVAEHLDIPLEVVNLIAEYRERVVDYLVQSYDHGLTPNPDVMCNRGIKFGAFLDYARNHGYAHVATGHYVRRITGEGALIQEGVDANKDQSYFLALLERGNIIPALFPVGNLAKPEVRDMAAQINLPNQSRKDSQGICFLGKVSVPDFLERFLGPQPGPIVNTDGKELGTHQGLYRFTIGQRKGIGVPSNTDNQAFVVVGKDADKNALIVAFDQPQSPGLYTSSATIHQVVCQCSKPWSSGPIEVRVRYRDARIPAHWNWLSDNSGKIEFQEPQRAIAPGQVMAFHQGSALLGGGIFG